MRETLARGEGAARINHNHPVIQRLGKSGQRNGNMPGSDNHQRSRGRETLYEDIKTLCPLCPLNGIGTCPPVCTPNGTLSIFNPQGIKPRVAQWSAPTPTPPVTHLERPRRPLAASFPPGLDGAEPLSAAKVATATRSPRSRQRSTSGNTSSIEILPSFHQPD